MDIVRIGTSNNISKDDTVKFTVVTVVPPELWLPLVLAVSSVLVGTIATYAGTT